MSTGSFTGTLSGFGIGVSVPLAGVAGLLGFMSAAATLARKKLIKETTKHEKTVSLAEAKHRSISRLVSKGLRDTSISDAEFASIMSEVEQYYDLKAKLRQKKSRSTVSKVDGATFREEIKKEFQKKLVSLLTLAKS